MDMKKLKQIMNNEDTIFNNINGVEYAIDLKENQVIREESFGFSVSELKGNDISYLKDELDKQIGILGIVEVAEALGMTRAGINWAINSNNYSRVPRPKYVHRNKRGNTYFWSTDQFK